MNKVILIFFFFLSFSAYSQKDTIHYQHSLLRGTSIYEVIYSIEGLLVEGEYVWKNNLDIDKFTRTEILSMDDAKKRYPYMIFRNRYCFIEELKIECLLVLNEIPINKKEDYRNLLQKYNQSDIKEIFYLKRSKAKKKYGKKLGIHGALIINTKQEKDN